MVPSVRTSVRIPGDLYCELKRHDLCFTDIALNALRDKINELNSNTPDAPPSSDQKVDLAIEKLDGDPDIRDYLISAGRIHRKVVSYVYGRVEWESGVVLSNRQKGRVKLFIEEQFADVRDRICPKHIDLDPKTKSRLKNYIMNTGYNTQLEVGGGSPEILQKIGEKFIQAGGPVKLTSLESIVTYLSQAFPDTL